jgi:hypothetical protein
MLVRAVAISVVFGRKNPRTPLWDKHMSNTWREGKEIATEMPPKNKELTTMLKKARDAPAAEERNIDLTDIHSMTLKRTVRKSKGNWFQIHKDIKNEEDQ